MRYRTGWFVCLILVYARIAASAGGIGVQLSVSASLMPSEDVSTFATNISLYAESQAGRWTGRIALGGPIKRWHPMISLGGEYSLGYGFGLSASLGLSDTSGYTHIFFGLGGKYTVLDDQFTIEIGGGGLGISAMRYKGNWTFGMVTIPAISLEAGWSSSGEIRFHERVSVGLGILPEEVHVGAAGLKRRYIVGFTSTTSIELTLPKLSSM